MTSPVSFHRCIKTAPTLLFLTRQPAVATHEIDGGNMQKNEACIRGRVKNLISQ